MKRFYDLVNKPWQWVPLWLRAHRFSQARTRQLDTEHIAWASALASERGR